MMKDVFITLPELDGKRFKLRGVRSDDSEALFEVYSDEKAVPFFNGDNCHGDDFHYTTKKRMNEAVEFWLWSYEKRYFVRWAIADKSSDRAIGTIELFHRDSDRDVYDNCGLLRLDLKSEYETRDAIAEILSLVCPPAFDLFYCDKIATKIKPFAAERLAAAKSAGFTPSPAPLIGDDGTEYFDYYILRSE